MQSSWKLFTSVINFFVKSTALLLKLFKYVLHKFVNMDISPLLEKLFFQHERWVHAVSGSGNLYTLISTTTTA